MTIDLEPGRQGACDLCPVSIGTRPYETPISLCNGGCMPYGRIDFERGGDLCVGSRIEEAGTPGCRVRVAGDSSWCVTCGSRWDTNTEEGNAPPECRLQVDPIRGGLLT